MINQTYWLTNVPQLYAHRYRALPFARTRVDEVKHHIQSERTILNLDNIITCLAHHVVNYLKGVFRQRHISY